MSLPAEGVMLTLCETSYPELKKKKKKFAYRFFLTVPSTSMLRSLLLLCRRFESSFPFAYRLLKVQEKPGEIFVSVK